MKQKMTETERLLIDLNKRMQSVENLLILQLIQNGATTEQISEVLQVESVAPSNLSASFPIKKLKKKEVKE